MHYSKTPKIVNAPSKILVGHCLEMSIINNRTGELWSQFAPKIKTIEHKIGSDKYSLQIYPNDYFIQFDPNKTFIKWAAVEVSDASLIPEGLDTLILDSGMYAIFDYKGSSSDTRVFQYIYNQWLPFSDYNLEDRPHFEVLGSRYINNDEQSEEEIWIPVSPK